MRTMPPICTMLGFGALQLRQELRRLGQHLGLGRPSPLELDALAPPDSAVARQAEALARDGYPDHLAGHAHRTWAFARAVSLHAGWSIDLEVLYVSTLLHDLGLCEAWAGPEPFEVRGARVAHETCVHGGLETPRADLARDAVALHTSLRAPLSRPEIRLVQTGSGGDLVGLDQEWVHPETRRAIRARWPTRPDFADRILADLKRETTPHPSSAGRRLLRAGFGGRVHAYQRRYALDG